MGSQMIQVISAYQEYELQWPIDFEVLVLKG